MPHDRELRRWARARARARHHLFRRQCWTELEHWNRTWDAELDQMRRCDVLPDGAAALLVQRHTAENLHARLLHTTFHARRLVQRVRACARRMSQHDRQRLADAEELWPIRTRALLGAWHACR